MMYSSKCEIKTDYVGADVIISFDLLKMVVSFRLLAFHRNRRSRSSSYLYFC